MGKPTIVLVHGAFADASSWNGVVPRLQARGYRVVAPANPLRGVTSDSAYVASLLQQIDGQVLLVGHSYGGAVITNAGREPNVLGLVFVAAFAPEESEPLSATGGDSKDSLLSTALVQKTYPRPDGTPSVEFSIDPAQFHDVFAHDLPPEQSAVMAATQRPIAADAFSDPSGPPAWRTLPSWAVVASGDRAAGADVTRNNARRAGAIAIEINGSHVIMLSQPETVANFILQASVAIEASPAAAAAAS